MIQPVIPKGEMSYALPATRRIVFPLISRDDGCAQSVAMEVPIDMGEDNYVLLISVLGMMKNALIGPSPGEINLENERG